MSSIYPTFVDLAGRRVLVVGGGVVAERKVRAWRETAAEIVVRSPAITRRLRALAEAGTIAWQRGEFSPDALEGVWLVIAATDFNGLNRRVAETAGARHIWINVVDDAALSSFQVPALVDRAPLQVAVSSGGRAPALSTAVRARIEPLLGDSAGSLALLLGRWRTRIKTALPETTRRRELYRVVLEGGLARAVRGVISGELADLGSRTRTNNVQPPALLIVGEVAALAPKLAWFGHDFYSPRSRLREVA